MVMVMVVVVMLVMVGGGGSDDDADTTTPASVENRHSVSTPHHSTPLVPSKTAINITLACFCLNRRVAVA